MPRRITLLYRGPLSSCNYDCSYCPFAKHHETAAELDVDRQALGRFVDWVAQTTNLQLSLFFTPWGEALTRRWYQTALQHLTTLPHVRRVAVQTNLSWDPVWLDPCDVGRLGLWCTYHPSQTSREEFLQRCRALRDRSVNHSVGMVAIPADYDEIELLRSELPDSTYLWLNAWDIGGGIKHVYSPQEVERLIQVDPHFLTNLQDHPSRGQACRSGSSVFSVDGSGTVRRCHFVDQPLGCLYSESWQFPTASSVCPNATCDCHIGYVHMPHLGLETVYGEGLLERVPLQVGFN